MKKIAAIILAAGASTRFGEPKQLLDWDGRPLLAHVADQALASGLDPVVVVLGAQAEAIGRALDGRPVQIAMSWGWEKGLSTSVQAGLAALPPEAEAVILMQSDQPLVTADLLRRLVARFRETGSPVVHPAHEGRRGTPTLFARRLFPELIAVRGDKGGREIIARHGEEVATVKVVDPAVLADVDIPTEYERLRAARLSIDATDEGRGRALSHVRHLIIDMDGVLWRGNEPMPGLPEFFGRLRERNTGFILATNNSSKLPEQYTEKLAGFGVEVSVEHVLTSAQVTAAYLAREAAPGTRVYAIGGEGLMRALEGRDFVLTQELSEAAEYVVVGWDRQLTWDKLATAALLIDRGAGFIGTNPDVNYPTERGPVPGAGAQLAALEVTTGVEPVVAGKPERWMYEEALRRMEASAETTAMIGDRLDTDIAGAARLGLTTVLLLSGIADEDDLQASLVKPDLVRADIRELLPALSGRAILAPADG